MVKDKEIVSLPRTLKEFKNWESNDGYNGVARAIRME